MVKFRWNLCVGDSCYKHFLSLLIIVKTLSTQIASVDQLLLTATELCMRHWGKERFIFWCFVKKYQWRRPTTSKKHSVFTVRISTISKIEKNDNTDGESVKSDLRKKISLELRHRFPEKREQIPWRFFSKHFFPFFD